MTLLSTKFFYTACLTGLLLGASSCKDQLDVGNPNAPTLSANVTNEAGLVSLAQGGVYINGFANGNGWLGDSYFSLPWGYIELMGDMVGADASNNQITTIAVPDYMILDDGTKVTNPAPQIGIIRTYNSRSATGAGNNPLIFQWQSMYALNNACNLVLSTVDKIKFVGDQASKANTVKAWCYWWKGYAYAQIGTLYYSGLIVDEASVTNNNFVLHDAVLDASNKYYNLAATTLSSVSSQTDYQGIMTQLIPTINQAGKGAVPTIDMWKRSINTMLARNILLNKLAPFVNGNPAAAIGKASMPAMTAADWNNVLTLTKNGIKASDNVFTGHNTGTNDFFTPLGGTVAALTTGTNSQTTFKISERFIQSYNTGDKRFTSNFNTKNTYKNNYNYTTRYNLVDGGTGTGGVAVLGTKLVGAYELYIAGSYEENALMQAEASMRTGDIEGGLTLVDAVRNAQGAGVAATVGAKLTLSKALTELTKERRVALFSRGIAFYDSRRWGWTYDIANGGGSYGNVVVTAAGVVNKNVTFNYNFLDYWDVPADETVLNPPGGTVATKNPNF